MYLGLPVLCVWYWHNMGVAVILDTAISAVELFRVDSVKVIVGAASVLISLSQP